MIKKNKLTPRQIKKAETKKKVFKAALKLFSDYGYDKVTVEDIVTKSGISKGVFYDHFKSKGQIVLDHFTEIDTYYIKKYKELDQYNNYTEKLQKFFEYQFRYCAHDMGLDTLKIVYASQLNSDADQMFLNDERRPLYSILLELIDQGQKLAEFRNDITPIEAVNIMINSTRGLVFDWCLSGGRFDLVKEGSTYVSRIIKSIK